VDVRYDIIKPIGYGAYGFVCSAKDSVTGEFVAIKKIPKVFDDLIDGKRILRETKLLPFLNHENIMSLMDVMRPREGYAAYRDIYLVSELMETDLHQVIRSKQPLSDEHVQYFSFQLFRALKYMHSAGVLHRDLKPGNLLVNANCDLKVCDFGLARGGLRGAIRKPQELTDYVITRWYRPPELLLMCHYSQAVDVWSAGLILMELILRKPALPGKDYVHQLTLITDLLGTPTDADLAYVTSREAITYFKGIQKKPKILSTVLPNSSKALLDLVSGCLEFNPTKRLTAEAVLQHPYYAHLYEPQDEFDFEPRPEFNVDWDFDYNDVTEPELRELFWEEVLKYHPTEPID